MRNTVKKFLENSSGVDAWSDVTYEELGFDQFRFKGTAYFRDLNEVNIHGRVKSNLFKPMFQKRSDGTLALILVPQLAG